MTKVPTVGAEPVPERRLSVLDLAVLWGDLSVGVLVLAAGALLVPALGLGQAFAAAAVGSVVGAIPVAMVGSVGAREGRPGMALFRPVLGDRGSWLPTVLNLVQLVGWTALELWAMAGIAAAVSRDLFGVEAFGLWLVLAAVGSAALALGGPVRVVRLWLERFGVWVVAACGLWLTWRLSSVVAEAWGQPGAGGWPTFPLAVDLVIAMCVSWLPLVADYTRFAAPRAWIGTYVGFAMGNAWFFALGAALATAGAAPDALGIGASVADLGGGLAVLLLLVAAESDEAFANIYSAAVSVRNLTPRVAQPTAVVTVTAVAAVLAATLSMADYQTFLFLIGSLFVPLFGVFLAAVFVKRRRGRATRSVDPGALVAWGLGFVVFQVSVPTGPAGWTEAVGDLAATVGMQVPLFGGTWGASLPSFAAAFLAAMVLVRKQPVGERPPGAPRSGPSTPT